MQFSKKSYWDFLSIFSADFFKFSHNVWSKINFPIFVYDSDPTKEHFYVYSTFYKNPNQKLGLTYNTLYTYMPTYIYPVDVVLIVRWDVSIKIVGRIFS